MSTALLPSVLTPLLGTLLMISILFVAIVYALSKALGSPLLSAFAKEELYALIFTVFIIAIWYLFTPVFSTITNSLVLTGLNIPPPASSPAYTILHIDSALMSTEVFIEKLINNYKNMAIYEFMIGFLSTINLPLTFATTRLSTDSIAIQPFIGLTLPLKAHNQVIYYFHYALGIVIAKKFFLLFARDVVPLIIFPLGILFRAFPPLRRTGSTILAFAFAFYFVFPLATLFSYYLIFDVYQPADFNFVPKDATPLEGDERAVEPFLQYLKANPAAEEIKELFETPSPAEKAAEEACEGFWASLWCGIKNILVALADLVIRYFAFLGSVVQTMLFLSGGIVEWVVDDTLFIAKLTSAAYYLVIYEVNIAIQLVVLIVITTVLEIIITVTMYRNIAELIGGETQLPGLTKII